jgi:hypothetical protein
MIQGALKWRKGLMSREHLSLSEIYEETAMEIDRRSQSHICRLWKIGQALDSALRELPKGERSHAKFINEIHKRMRENIPKKTLIESLKFYRTFPDFMEKWFGPSPDQEYPLNPI